MKRELSLGTRCFFYELSRKHVKRINAHVDRKGNILVSAPPFVKIERIDAFILENAERLLSAADKQKAVLRDAPVFREGAILSLLGEKKRLHICHGSVRGVNITGDMLTVTLGENEDETEASRRLAAYLARTAVEILTRLYDACYDVHFSGLFPKPALRFRRMRGAWGNCRRERGVITLNLRLVYAPPSAIEYVVLHELVHMLHPDHSPRFWSTVGKYMGDYAARRALLSGISIALDPFL